MLRNQPAFPTIRSREDREAGSALLLTVLILALLSALLAAQSTVQQKNVRQSSSYFDRSDLLAYAESAVALSLHDLRERISANPGRIGTDAWTPADDVGGDGRAATGDAGEADGYPTPGEPHVVPAPMGPPELETVVIAHPLDLGFGGFRRIIATAIRGDETVTVEDVVQESFLTLPRAGALYVEPEVVLDLSGNALTIDGNDTNLDGSAGSGSATYAIATETGEPEGSNAATLETQISSASEDRLLGLGDPPVGEVDGVDVDALFDQFAATQTLSLEAGNYSSVTLGTTAEPEVTYVRGDLHLSGSGQGAGVLVVDGSVTFSGSFEFVGVVLVRGDVRLTGGGNGVHVYGSVMAGESFTAVENTMTLTGTADVKYSTEALAVVDRLLAERPLYDKIDYRENPLPSGASGGSTAQ